MRYFRQWPVRLALGVANLLVGILFLLDGLNETSQRGIAWGGSHLMLGAFMWLAAVGSLLLAFEMWQAKKHKDLLPQDGANSSLVEKAANNRDKAER